MVATNAFEYLRQITRTLLYSDGFVNAHRMRKTDFIRKRKLPFSELVAVILKGAKRGLHTAVLEMLESDVIHTDSYSEAALCKARKKINYTAFKELFREGGKAFYHAATKCKRFKKKYTVWAIDGSKINLPTNPDTLSEFGSEPFDQGERAQGLGSCLYDALNGVTLDATLERFDANERELASGHIEYLKDFCTETGRDPHFELVTLDRGYPSEALIRQISNAGFKFVIRSNNKNFWKEVRDAIGPDSVVTRGDITLRVVRVPLAHSEMTVGGESVSMTTFLTNLSEKEASPEDIAQLYHLRWNIETNYNFLKSRIELENFTGISSLCLRQDFYAALYFANMIACAQYDAAAKLQKHNKGKKLTYKVNYTEAYRRLQRRFFALILLTPKKDFNRAYARLQNEIMDALIPIRPDRHPQRAKPHVGPRFHTNHKPS